MNKNLFEQAKEMMTNFRNEQPDEHHHNSEDREAVRQAIQAAYNEATPEQKNQLQHFEQQLDEKINFN